MACRQVDEFIDEALEGQDFTMDTLMEVCQSIYERSKDGQVRALIVNT